MAKNDSGKCETTNGVYTWENILLLPPQAEICNQLYHMYPSSLTEIYIVQHLRAVENIIFLLFEFCIRVYKNIYIGKGSKYFAISLKFCTLTSYVQTLFVTDVVKFINY